MLNEILLIISKISTFKNLELLRNILPFDQCLSVILKNKEIIKYNLFISKAAFLKIRKSKSKTYLILKQTSYSENLTKLLLNFNYDFARFTYQDNDISVDYSAPKSRITYETIKYFTDILFHLSHNCLESADFINKISIYNRMFNFEFNRKNKFLYLKEFHIHEYYMSRRDRYNGITHDFNLFLPNVFFLFMNKLTATTYNFNCMKILKSRETYLRDSDFLSQNNNNNNDSVVYLPKFKWIKNINYLETNYAQLIKDFKNCMIYSLNIYVDLENIDKVLDRISLEKNFFYLNYLKIKFVKTPSENERYKNVRIDNMRGRPIAIRKKDILNENKDKSNLEFLVKRILEKLVYLKRICYPY